MMALTASLRTFSRLSWFQRVLLAEALATLAASSLAIKLAPFRRVVQAAASSERPAAGDERRQAEIVKQARWAVGAWADRVPWKAVCFQRGLALHLMLRRRGVPSVLHYGVAQIPERGLSAHVWISSRGQIVLGGEEADRFACLASFPAKAG